ncbi:MAG: hypothetical protein JXN61_03305 [Sedimentisphaerales bacterium]|nr:hypothetical protein [Sedimentisphaerales bacterium]
MNASIFSNGTSPSTAWAGAKMYPPSIPASSNLAVATRLSEMNCRAAIIGLEGSGKTTLMENLQAHLQNAGGKTRSLFLNDNNPLTRSARKQFLSQLDADEIVFLDGAGAIGRLAWLSLKRSILKRAAGLVITAHRPGLLPTLIECKTTPALFRQIIADLLPDPAELSGGCGGQRIRNVTVENVSLKKGYLRGAVEVSDGADNVTVRRVRAEDAVYAIDVQDHRAVQKGTPKPSAPNTNVTVEDVTAVSCKQIIRTANRPLGHANLTLRDFTARNCTDPVLISNTTHVRIRNLTIINEPVAEKPRIALRNCDDVELHNVKIIGLKDGALAVAKQNSINVRIEELTRDDKGGDYGN